jgi:Bacterial Ig-like domain (group 3)/FG-GAP-like repeat
MLRRLLPSTLFLVFVTVSLPASSLFQPAKTYLSGGAGLSAIAVADVNDDGRLDLVISNYCADYSPCAEGNVAVLLGNGDGTFQAAQTYLSGGSGAGGMALADLNRDGVLDIVVTNACASGGRCDGSSNTGSVAVLLGNGDGTFKPAQTFTIGAQSPGFLAVGDFNGDGKIDVATVNLCNFCTGDQVSVLLGNGNGTLQSPQTYDLGGQPLGIAVGDVNGDGKLDLLVGGEGVFLGRGDGTFDPQPVSGAGWFATLADINGDGKLDLLQPTACSNPPSCTKSGVGVALGNGDGTFQTLQNYSSGGSESDFVAVGDVNRDGKLDVFVANYASPRFGILLGLGDGTLSPVQLSNPGVGSQVSIAVGDLNGDGKPDLIVGIGDLNNEVTTSGVGVLLNNTFWTTTTTIRSHPNPSIQGQAVTFKARVVSMGSIPPTGTVAFKNGDTQIGTATLSRGVATLTKKNLPVGSLSITASYKGDTQSGKSSSSTLIQVVNPGAKP